MAADDLRKLLVDDPDVDPKVLLRELAKQAVDPEVCMEVSIAKDCGCVQIDFQEPVDLLFLNPEMARDLAERLLRMAAKLEGPPMK